MKFKRHAEGFRDYLRTHHFAARTLETYGANTKRFLAFLEQRYPSINTVEQVTKDTILDYQRHLAEHEDPRIGALTHATQNLILRSVRKFFHYLLRGDFILRDPTSVLEFPKEEQKLIRNVLSEDEVSGLLEQIKPIGPEGLRNRAIVELLYACGIRTTELCQLRVADLDLKEQTATIMKGKGGKSRVVPIGQYACHYIAEYLRKGRKYFLRGRADDPGLLFLSGWGNPFNASTINRSVMWKIAAEVGLKKDLTCYTFRHSVATHMLRNDANVMFIAKLLRPRLDEDHAEEGIPPRAALARRTLWPVKRSSLVVAGGAVPRTACRPAVGAGLAACVSLGALPPQADFRGGLTAACRSGVLSAGARRPVRHGRRLLGGAAHLPRRPLRRRVLRVESGASASR